MQLRMFLLIYVAAIFIGCAPEQPPLDREILRQQVIETERAFAATMARRDFSAFASFLSQEAVFFSGPQPLRGARQVAGWWKKYFEGSEAPFSWAPDRVEVLDSGTLALSTGPIHDSDGRLSGTFISIWRLEALGTWRIIFDKGCPVCE